ncbi:unnamed protein product [Cylindrotheca closterium]|uniref:Uncharacterized protein n=1 Tax=Cylindrotheca closterium TaxID=2856 RepID=A0AAD2FDR8_9STRA|nr:unnamed protein product [Cylindrotheca closterium]
MEPPTTTPKFNQSKKNKPRKKATHCSTTHCPSNTVAMPIAEQIDDERKISMKMICPYCDVVFIIAVLISIAALVMSLLQAIYGVLAVMVFIITLANCFFHSKTKRLGMILAGILEFSMGGICVLRLLHIEDQCDPDTIRYLPCSMLTLAITAGLWMLSGLLILYFVYSGRVGEYIKEGLDIEAVATPLGCVEEPLDQPPHDLEQGDHARGDPDGSENDGDEDQGNNRDRSTELAPASATICIIPDDDSNEMSAERKEKLEQSVPITPARPLESSERSTVSYLPNGIRERNDDEYD